MWAAKNSPTIFSLLFAVAYSQNAPSPSPPPSSLVTIALQTGAQTGSPIQTTHQSISGLTANSVTTTVVGGTTTVLPVWYCAPSETAAACHKDCPQSPGSPNSEPACGGGFNALVLVPIMALPGFFLPPPEGLPTLTIGDGDAKIYTPQAEPTPKPDPRPSSATPNSSPTPTPTPTQKDEPPNVSCMAPVNKITDKARPTVTTRTFGGTATFVPEDPIDIETNPLPFLKFTQPGALSSCGGGGTEGRYIAAGFNQYGNAFARTDGISALNQFCAMHAKNGSVLGPDGFKGDPNWSKHTAKHIYQGDFNTKKSGKITVRAIYDVDNRISKLRNEKDCNKNGDDDTKAWLIGLFEQNMCRNYFGQSIDFCDIGPDNTGTRSADDTKWKKGGTFYHRCGIWEIFKTPDSDTARPLRPDEVHEAPDAGPVLRV